MSILLVAFLSTTVYPIAPVSAVQEASFEHSMLLKELRLHAHPLDSAYPHATDADLQPVFHAVGKAKIVAVGESTHGTGDFFAIKDRIFRYLAEHDGVRVLAMEANWADGLAIDEYLQTGNGNLGNILSRTWDYREVRELLEWMRRYNEQHPHALHFFGVDMQQPDTVVPYIVDFYDRFAVDKRAAVNEALACINKPTSTLFLRGLSDADACLESTRSVVQQLVAMRQHETAGDRNAYRTALYAAELTEEAATEYSKSDLEEKAAARDLAMAHNVEWLLGTLESSSKIFVWAHNDHIAVGMEQWPSMGTILRKAYGEDYFAIGQTFDHGMVAQAQVAAVDVPQPQLAPARPYFGKWPPQFSSLISIVFPEAQR